MEFSRLPPVFGSLKDTNNGVRYKVWVVFYGSNRFTITSELPWLTPGNPWAPVSSMGGGNRGTND